MVFERTVEIAEGIYWVGGGEQDGGLHCNPYLVIDGEEAVLIDPGSVLDFESVLKNVTSLVPLENIKYVVLHHQDPDFCASVPLFEKEGAVFKIITHWRTQALVKYYGVKSDYYIVNENEFRLTLKSGRVLEFVQTPYLHFPGAIATYDCSTGTLFSSDIFGAFSFEWSLYAGDDYMEKMKTFHEHYMPSNDIIRPVMEIFLSMDISMIAPQHGSIIKKNIKEHIKALRDLECGSFLATIKKDIGKSGGFRFLCSTVLKRYGTIFKKEEVLEVVKEMDITLDADTMEITDYNYRGTVFWNLIFEQILARKGVQWLVVIEPLVQKLSREYDIPIPEVFNTTLIRSQQEAANLNKENVMLKEINERLKDSIKEAQDKLIKCNVTGLYNYEFFKNYLSNNINTLLSENSEQNLALIIISTDNISKIEFLYGSNEVDEVLKTFLENLKYKVFTATDGEEALNISERESLDLIISEVMLPKLDGFQIRENLLSQSHTKGIPFIIVSYLKNDDSVQRASALEVEHYFKKPYMLSELIGVIRNRVKGDAYQ